MQRCKVGNVEINFSRNQIIDATGTVQQLEPRVSDVLKLLIEHPEDVFSAEVIFERVWQDTTFSPSTVQRAIALIRKALNDDAKNPKFIKTFSKRGYAFIAPVSDLDADLVAQVQHKRQGIFPFRSFVIAFVIASIAMTLSYLLKRENNQVKTDFTKLYPITSHSENEYSVQYSPSGEYLLFLRDEAENSGNNIWLKRLSDATEIKLTDDTINYSSVTWAPTGDRIAFLQQLDSSDEIGFLRLDNTNEAIEEHKIVKSFPKRSILGHQFQWSKEDHLYFISIPEANLSKLFRLHLQSGSVELMVRTSGKDLIQNIALNLKENILAYTKSVKQNRYEIVLFNVASRKSQLLTTLEDGILGFSWHPTGQYLLASNRKTLQLIDRAGVSQEIVFNNYHTIIDPSFSPTGDKIVFQSLAMDVDILYSEYPFTSIEKVIDSKAVDLLPSFSPDEQSILFMSDRNGFQQLFIKSKDNDARLIFKNPRKEELFGSAWSPDGQRIAVAIKDRVYFINVKTGDTTEQIHNFAPFYIKDWFHEQDALLITGYQENQFVPTKYNINSNDLSTFDGYLESQRCTYMTLDANDNLFITNSKEIYKISDSRTEMVWRSEAGAINGFSIDNEQLVVMQTRLEPVEQVTFTKVDMKTGDQQDWYQYNPYDFKVANGNRDNSKFLMHSWPTRIRTIVSLE
ncbi:MAG: hypothetical protein GJ680_14975 [Alteromonadaceae bacterium]|nr:hypothetical protein [Alteromonadaceae bacterium]